MAAIVMIGRVYDTQTRKSKGVEIPIPDSAIDAEGKLSLDYVIAETAKQLGAYNPTEEA